MLSEKPASFITKKVGISEIGMAAAVISVARQSRRKNSTTSAARNMPSASTCWVALKLSRVSSTDEKIFENLTAGLAFSISASFLMTESSVTTSLASLVLATWKPTTGRPLRRAKPRGSEAPSPMSATSDSFTNRPPPVGMVSSRSWATVFTLPSTRTVCSRPPTFTRPPGASIWKLRNAVLTWVAVRPRAARRSGSIMTLISRATPPTRVICDTPSAVCRVRLTVLSTNQLSWSSLMEGAATA